MALIKVQSEGINLADDFTFTGTVAGAGGVNTPMVQELFHLANQTVTYATSYYNSFVDTELH
jgi:hypothetical protein